MKIQETEVLIIGGGVTGAGVMRDLAMRGIHCLLIDKTDLCAGASGGNHGLLHSGARYAVNDQEAAIECRKENACLKRIIPQCIEETGAFFVATEHDDDAYAAAFHTACVSAGISCDQVSTQEARRIEPLLTDRIKHVYRLPDATVDPFRLALANVDHARRLNDSLYYSHMRLMTFSIKHGHISCAVCQDTRTGERLEIHARQFINAGGAWAMEIAATAGCRDVNLLFSKGTLLVSNDRLCHHILHRLRPPGDGDILVPGGTVSILGTTSIRVTDLETIEPSFAEIETNVNEGSVMVPQLKQTRYIRAFARVRPLLQPSKNQSGDRQATRGFNLLDHSDRLDNFCTITGGKLTTYRLMAEKTVDLVAERFGNKKKCQTHQTAIEEDPSSRWTEPGASPKYWFMGHNPNDLLLCECEMVPQSAIDEIISGAKEEQEMTLEAIALRSRAGKGPCQGAFCSLRIASYLYDRGYYTDDRGLEHLKKFLNERFKGIRSISWGQQTAQLELAEALHCGLLGLDKPQLSPEIQAPEVK